MASRRSRYAIDGRELEEQGVRNADAFVKLSPRSQVLEKPGMYIGSITPEPTVLECFDGTSIRRKEIPDYIEGVDILNKEALDNAVDNCLYSIHTGRKPDEIHVTLTATTIIVENGGCNVPVEKMSTGEYVPTVLWGSLFTSSHYDEAKRKYKASSSSGGTNGVGGSLINIFSDKFEVLVEDPESQKRFQQTWSRGKPIIIDGQEQGPTITSSKKITETKIRITYDLNFKYFGIERYSPLMLQRLAYRAVTASFTAKVPVHITNEEGVTTTYDLRLISDYAALFPELRPSPEIKRLEYYALSAETTKRKISYAEAMLKHVEIPRIEALLVDELVPDDEPEIEDVPKKKGSKKRPVRVSSKKPTGALQISLVNGIVTTQHGVHVDELIKAFFGEALSELKISLAHGKRYISFLLSVRLSNPQFRGQHKATLSSPRPEFDGITPAMLRALRQWNTMDRLKDLNDAEKTAGLKKSDGKKLRRVTAIKNLDDANLAGTSHAYKCTLIIVEGGSAATYPEIMRDRIEGGRDLYGILPLRGKPLNVLNASVAQLAGETGSMVYPNFKQAIGLQDGMDYSIAANFKKLRYGHVLIATDADCDGWHILCLLILMFFSRFPSLINRGYVSYLRTPVLRVPGTQGLTFYTKRAYEDWKRKAQETGGAQGIIAKRKPKYYKGLGTSSAKDVEEDLRARRGKLDIDDEDGQGAEALDLGFNEKRTRDRKEWLATPVVGEFLDTEAQTQGVAHFVHTGLKLYSLDNIQRAIPNVMDGLKESMRKALCAGIKKFGLSAGDKHLGLTKEERKAAGLKSTTSASYAVPPEAKVFQIIGTTTEYYCYHHGEQILGEVVCNMCKNYVGTNNVTWFQPVSSFGTIDSGKSPDPRYAALGPAWWWSYAYHTADADLVERVEDEGHSCEPRFMLPVACWALCNAADGVGTGYSTRIPGHNIEEVVLAHMMLLDGQTSFPKLLPWWRGFKGNVSLMPRSKARRMVVVEKTVHEDDIEVEDEDSVAKDEGEPETAPAPELATHKKRKSKKNEAELKIPKEDPMVCIVDGTYTIRDNTVIVTSLPLRTFSEFKDIIVKLIDDKIVSDFRNLSSGENILFEIDMVVDEETGKLPPGNIMKLFRLRRIITMSNLVLLDERGLPKRFKSAEDILTYFHNVRLEYYERRRRAIIEDLREKLIKLEQKMRLIQAFTSDGPDKIVYEKRDQAELLAEIAEKLPDIPESIYHELAVSHVNKTQILKLSEQIKTAQEALDEMLKTTKETMWKKDLKVFLKEYRAVYGSTLSPAYQELSIDS